MTWWPSVAFKARTTRQLPVFVCAQAENDLPVGMVFPLGNAGHAITEATIDELEQWCVRHAIGFVPDFPHHALRRPRATSPSCCRRPGPLKPIDSGWWERRRK